MPVKAICTICVSTVGVDGVVSTLFIMLRGNTYIYELQAGVRRCGVPYVRLFEIVSVRMVFFSQTWVFGHTVIYVASPRNGRPSCESLSYSLIKVFTSLSSRFSALQVASPWRHDLSQPSPIPLISTYQSYTETPISYIWHPAHGGPTALCLSHISSIDFP